MKFTKLMRLVLYNNRLTWGARILGIALLDIPLSSDPTHAKLARKLGTSDVQVARWKDQLLASGFTIVRPSTEAK